MSNTTIAKSIKVVTYLQEQNSHLIGKTGTIYIPTEKINTLANLLTLAQHQSAIIKSVKEYIEKLKEQIREQLDKEPEEIDLYTLEKTITDLDFYILAEELKAKKR